jgi:hypothetical protein
MNKNVSWKASKDEATMDAQMCIVMLLNRE